MNKYKTAPFSRYRDTDSRIIKPRNNNYEAFAKMAIAYGLVSSCPSWWMHKSRNQRSLFQVARFVQKYVLRTIFHHQGKSVTWADDRYSRVGWILRL